MSNQRFPTHGRVSFADGPSVPATIYGEWNGFAKATTTVPDALKLLGSNPDITRIVREKDKITCRIPSSGTTEEMPVHNGEATFGGGWALSYEVVRPRGKKHRRVG